MNVITGDEILFYLFWLFLSQFLFYLLRLILVLLIQLPTKNISYVQQSIPISIKLLFLNVCMANTGMLKLVLMLVGTYFCCCFIYYLKQLILMPETVKVKYLEFLGRDSLVCLQVQLWCARLGQFWCVDHILVLERVIVIKLSNFSAISWRQVNFQ